LWTFVFHSTIKNDCLKGEKSIDYIFYHFNQSPPRAILKDGSTPSASIIRTTNDRTMKQSIKNNAGVLSAEMEWLHQLIDLRLRLYFNDEPAYEHFDQLHAPVLKSDSFYAGIINKYNLQLPERIVLALALAPHLKPEILDGFFTKNNTYDKRFTEFGGAYGNNLSFLPTVETALFLLAGTHLEDRLMHYPFLLPCSQLLSNKMVRLEPGAKDEPFLNSLLILSEEYRLYFITGEMRKTDFNEAFPAKLITTALNWNDVVLPQHTMDGLQEIQDWMEHGQSLLDTDNLGKRIKPGYKSLFYGPPGTGKTLTASLLGKSTGRDVYKIDLSMVVSKYIGETEKNLARVFDLAEDKKWILFFDEADALFGKRTELNSSNDRYANQEVAYLLQRVEDHRGVVILASNLKDNIDKAFARRFQSVIHFPMPGVEERYLIWKQSFSEKIPPAKEVNLSQIAERHVLTGGLMMNIIRNCSVKALKNKREYILQEDLEDGIKKELQKDGIILT
jgi:hypothetical protein